MDNNRSRETVTDLPDVQNAPNVQAAFAPLADLPCWNVYVGYAANLSLDFGLPHLEISPSLPRRKRERPPRHVHVKGEWHLWIHVCNWYVFQDGRLKGGIHTLSSQTRAERILRGRKLERVVVTTLPGRTVFYFEDNVQLCTRPYRPLDREDEQWIFFEPSKMVWTLYADGFLEHKPANTPAKSRGE